MKRIFRKNQIVVAALALLFAGAGYLNYTYENDEKMLKNIKELLPNVYICNLDGIVIK